MTKRECCLVWAAALGMALVPIEAHTADDAYGEWVAGENAYTIEILSGEYNKVYGYRDGTSSGGSTTVGKVKISGGTITGNVYGGYSNNDNVVGNSVEILSDNVELNKSVFAGYTEEGEAQNNTVVVEGGTTNAIAAGYSISGTACANSVVISGGTINSAVRGNRTDTGTATGVYTVDGIEYKVTAVTVTGGTLNSSLYGGYATSGTAAANDVIVTGSDASDEIEVGMIRGGYAKGDGTAKNNTVTISGNVTVTGFYDSSNHWNVGDVAGGYVYAETDNDGNYTTSGNVTANVVTLKAYVDSDGNALAPTVKDSVYGGYTASGEAAGNSVVISSATVGEIVEDSEGSKSLSGGNVYGNYSGNGDAFGYYTDDSGEKVTLTSVKVTGGTIYGRVYGGYSVSGEASCNTVEVTGGSVGSGITTNDKAEPVLCGGYSESGDVLYNEVKLGTESAESSYTVSINGHVHGGYTAVGNVVGNSVKILSGVELTGSVYAGRTVDGYAQANSITLAAGSIVTGTGIGDLWGNYTASDDDAFGIDENGIVVTSVTVTGGTANTITAGYSKSGTAYANSVDISDGIINSTVRGNRTDTGTATGQYTTSDGTTAEVTAVTVTGGTLESTLYGGYANSSGTATVNTVDISGGTVNKPYAGYSKTGKAYLNVLKISGGTVTTAVGGGTYSGEVYKNIVEITGGTVTNVYGGYSNSDSSGEGGTGTVHDNIVSISAGMTIGGSVWGGYSENGIVYSSSVTVSGYDVKGSVYGGHSGSNTAEGNSVNLSSQELTSEDGTTTTLSPTVSGSVYGNYSESGAALGYYIYTDDSGDEVTVQVTSIEMSSGTVGNAVYGGKGASAEDNSVEISGDAYVGLYVVGGEATGDTSSSTGNSVSLSGSAIIGIYSKDYTDSSDYTADAEVIGGWAAGTESSATDNSVTISNSVKIYGNVTGGYGTGKVFGNSVTMNGGEVTGDVYGGYSDSSSGVVSGNIVTLSGTASVDNYIIGGKNTENAEVSENEVIIKESAYASYVYGGESDGRAYNNKVSIEGDGKTINSGYVYGGKSISGDADENTVTISNSVIKDSNYEYSAQIVGGYASGNVTQNEVSIEKSVFSGYFIVGGYSYGSSSDASANSVTIENSTISSLVSNYYGVYGNYSDYGDAVGYYTSTDDEGNTTQVSVTSVVIESSDVTGSVYGGYSNNGAAKGNSVSLSGTSDEKTSITGSVYGGYGTTATGNSVSIYGYVSVTGTIYGGNVASTTKSSDDYNTLWVAGTENSALTLANFDTITFDISGLNNGDTMLTLSAKESDLTGVSSIGLDKDNAAIASGLGEVLYLISTSGTLSVTAESLQGLDGEMSYVLDDESDTSGSLIVGEASLEGYCKREIQVISYVDGKAVEQTADSEGVITGEDLVMRIGDTVYVTKADFALAGSESSNAEYEWETALITLDDVKYVFSSDTKIEDIGPLTVRGEAVSGTLIADDASSTLLDGSKAESVTDLSVASLDDLQNISITYTPESGVTVTGTAYVAMETLNEESSDADSLALVSSSINSVTFASIAYVSQDEGALISLDGKSTYDMSETKIDVSGLTLVDSSGNSISPTVDDEDVGEIVMTLIASNGSVTNLGQNSYVNGGADISESQTFGYILTGSTYNTDDGTGASLEGTLEGYVISEKSSSDSSSELSVLSVASEEAETTKTTDTYDLVLKTGTSVAVTSVAFSLAESETLDDTVTVELSSESTALITLNSELTYDFTDAELTDTSATVEVTGDAIDSTLLANDVVIIELLSTNGATIAVTTDEEETSSLTVLSDQVASAYSNYTYTPVSGVTVTGDTATVTDYDETDEADDDGISLTVGTIGTVTFGEIEYAETVLTLDGTSTYDMSKTEIDVSNLTIVDDGSGTISSSYDGNELVMTLIDANGSVTNLDENEIAEGSSVAQTFVYELIGTYGDGDVTGASLEGTLAGYVSVEADASGNASSHDLLIRTGTTVTVTDVDLDISSLDVEGEAQLTLSALSYDFSALTSDGISITGADGETTIENASTLIDSITLIDGSSAADVTGMGVLAGYCSVYSYSIGDDIDVTGEGATVISSDGKTLSYDILNILTLDFWIDEDTSTDEPMLTVDTADLSGTEITAHAKSGDYLKDGYEVVLIEATEEDGLTTDDGTTYAGEIYDGVSVEYELEVTKEGDTIVARVTGGDSLREETESLPQTRLVQVAMVDASVDQLVLAFDDAFKTVREKTKWTPYIAMSLGDFEFSSGHGGKIDIESFNATVGLLRNYFLDDGVFSWGPVFQFGHADYDSAIGNVTALGDSEHYGGGLFARRRWDSGTYIEGAITAGYSDADYASVTILDGTYTSFSVGSPYWSAYAGLAKDYTNEHGRTFKPYIRYYYSHLDDTDASLSSGELYRFSSVDSSRLRIGFRITWDLEEEPSKKNTSFAYLGAAFQYQFDGAAVGVYNGMSTLEPSLKGGSGVIEGGLRFMPKDSPVTIDIGVAGWSGAQQGIEGVLKVKWDM